MKAVVQSGAGGPEVLAIEERPDPEAGPGQILVEVAASAVNRADVLQRKGFYPAPPGAPADIPGLEYAGTVVAVGEGVTTCSVGDRVMGIVAGGAMAEKVAVHHSEAIPVPENVSLEQAAAIPEVFLTAFDAVFVQGELRMGETVLVHSVGSGVGTALVQLARCAGATSIGTARTESKLARAQELGLDHGIHVTDQTFADKMPNKANVVLCTVGAAYLSENIKALAPRGHIVVIGLMGGVKGEVNLGTLLAKRGRLSGSVLRARPLHEKADLAQRATRELVPLFARGALKPVIEATMPMKDIAVAHETLESNSTFGKLVLAW